MSEISRSEHTWLNIDQFLDKALRKKIDELGGYNPFVDLFVPESREPLSGESFTSAPDVGPTHEVKAAIQEDVETFIKSLDYYGLHFPADFVKFSLENPDMSVTEAFLHYTPNSQNEAVLLHGSTCVGKALSLVEKLAEKGHTAHVVVERDGPDEPVTHAAVALPCNDGILLIEVEHEYPIITILPEESRTRLFMDEKETLTFEVGFKMVKNPGNYESTTPLIVKSENNILKKTSSHSEYLLRPVHRPDMSVMKNWMLHTDFFPITAKVEGQPDHVIKIYPGKKIVTFQLGTGKKAYRINIPFSDFQKDGTIKPTLNALKDWERETFLGDDFFKAFKAPKSLIMEEIFTLATHPEIIIQLKEQLRS